MSGRRDAAAAPGGTAPGRGGPADLPVAGVILAAGLSSRMAGGHKLLLPYGATTVVGAVAAAAAAAGLRPVVAVTGHLAGAVRRALAGSGVEPVENPRFASGRRSSLAVGIAAAAAAPVGAAVVLLGDEPGLRPEAIRRVVEAWRAEGMPSARTRYRDRPGHPILFDRSVFPLLVAAGEGETFAGGGPDDPAGPPAVEPREVEVDLEAPVDVDTRADHAAALARLRG